MRSGWHLNVLFTEFKSCCFFYYYCLFIFTKHSPFEGALCSIGEEIQIQNFYIYNIIEVKYSFQN